ncbi:uncharacterized protein BYT42DRAFT_547343 [Radiomyces spectabilis]|uniref:uncharacterized protein n=1 Tax=Radiomyces spectabilis TaxID=64574 RepID=UPI00221F3BD4|nr:uncharacterized protein BYT42DRAFT_547343 [Radiomyces spectabilis]KAI8374279.1 hypothetical protein BYT42DRAFT_547343 [Radiomyces spectabilis]
MLPLGLVKKSKHWNSTANGCLSMASLVHSPVANPFSSRMSLRPALTQKAIKSEAIDGPHSSSFNLATKPVASTPQSNLVFDNRIHFADSPVTKAVASTPQSKFVFDNHINLANSPVTEDSASIPPSKLVFDNHINLANSPVTKAVALTPSSNFAVWE